MPYYDRIAERWERSTGHRGGALKRQVLNQLLLEAMGPLDGVDVLELGAGNGYLMRLAWERLGPPARVVISDVSPRLLDVARAKRPVPGAEYRVFDARRPFPFEGGSFDLVAAAMVFNELGDRGLGNALGESRRVLRAGGRLAGALVHPRLVASLSRRGELRRSGLVTMPGADGLRLPIVERPMKSYEAAFARAGFSARFDAVFAPPEVVRDKPGLARAGGVPAAATFEATAV